MSLMQPDCPAPTQPHRSTGSASTPPGLGRRRHSRGGHLACSATDVPRAEHVYGLGLAHNVVFRKVFERSAAVDPKDSVLNRSEIV